MRPGLHNAQFLPPSVSSSHGNWTVGAHGQRENQFCETDESVHDRPRIRVNQARLHTDSLTVRTKSLVLKNRPNLVKLGHNSGKRLKMVDFGSLANWCEPRATPCKPGSRECGQAPRTAQRPSDPRVDPWRHPRCASHAVAYRVTQKLNHNLDARSVLGCSTCVLNANRSHMLVVRNTSEALP